jgi:ribosomal protein S18 acetylase RimI-like enzyme
MSKGADSSIQPVTAAEFSSFVEYLNDHLSDNGVGGQYFLPLQRDTSRLPLEKEASFRAGMDIPVGRAAWRRVWVARSPEHQIVGHVDLCSHPERFTEHRCLLGMGVHREHRRLGLGAALLAYSERWASAIAGLEWMDLKVLSANEPAIRLYLRAGFIKVGEVADMFMIDGRALSYSAMTKKLAKPTSRAV